MNASKMRRHVISEARPSSVAGGNRDGPEKLAVGNGAVGSTIGTGKSWWRPVITYNCNAAVTATHEALRFTEQRVSDFLLYEAGREGFIRIEC